MSPLSFSFLALSCSKSCLFDSATFLTLPLPNSRMYTFLVSLLQPFLLLMLAQGTALLVLARCAKSHRRLSGSCFACYALLWLFCTPLVAHWSAAILERDYPPLIGRPADIQAIVVLGSGVIPPAAPEFQTHLSERGLRRCLRAGQLYHQGLPCLVLAAGGKGDKSLPGEAEGIAMHEMLQRLGVPATDIAVESRSLDTFENAVNAGKVLSQRGIDRVALVTDAMHLRRATSLFRRQGLTVIPAASHYYASEFRWDVFAVLPDLGAAGINAAVFHELLGTLWGELRESRSGIAEALLAAKAGRNAIPSWTVRQTVLPGTP